MHWWCYKHRKLARYSEDIKQKAKKEESARIRREKTALDQGSLTFLAAPQEKGCCCHQLSCSKCYQRLMITTAEQFTCLHLQSAVFLHIKRSFDRIRLPFTLRNYQRERYFSLLTWFSQRWKQLQDLWNVLAWSPAPSPSFFTNQRLQPDHCSLLPAQSVLPSFSPKKKKAHLFSVNAVNQLMFVKCSDPVKCYIITTYYQYNLARLCHSRLLASLLF